MRMGAEDVAARERADAPPKGRARWRPFLLRYLRPRTGALLVLWRLEAYTAVPLALLLVATLGRWPGALVMGCVMAVYATLFMYLLEDEPALDDIRAWASRWRIGRALERLAARDDAVGMARKGVAAVLAVIFLGPFWRTGAFHLLRIRRAVAYPLSVGGSIPHSLLWTGLVLGGIWEGLVWPLVKRL
jgi:hypothetical protein